MTTAQKFLLLTCLYFSQGVPFGFFTQALPVLMRERGASLPEIGLTSLLALPWALKFLWAPLVDRYGVDAIGRRKSWILFLQLAGAVLFVVLGLLSDQHGYGYLVWGFFLANLISATQDIASDGLAVSLLSDRERGPGNGLQVAGYRLGMVFGGGFVLIFFGALEWLGAFAAMALALVLATLPTFYYSEPAAAVDRMSSSSREMLLELFQRPGFPRWLLLISFYKFGDALATTQILRPFLVDRGLGLEEIGRLLGTVGFLGGLLGALAGGFLLRYTGRYGGIALFGIIQAAAVFGYFLLSRGWFDSALLYPLCGLEHFTGGMATAALFTAMMDVCRPASGSTDYTLQASFVVIATGSAGALGGFTAEYWGYTGNFLLSGCLSLAAALIFAVIFRRRLSLKEPLRLE